MVRLSRSLHLCEMNGPSRTDTSAPAPSSLVALEAMTRTTL
uniref:Uncharacterized protein n=1 Tax=Arundo donax TaxID=35708 RepID=A0A0A9ERA7_ARUDO